MSSGHVEAAQNSVIDRRQVFSSSLATVLEVMIPVVRRDHVIIIEVGNKNVDLILHHSPPAVHCKSRSHSNFPPSCC